jgi:hypothetical protein
VSYSNAWDSQVRKRSAEILAQLCASAPKRAVVEALLDVKPLSRSELEQLVDTLKAGPQLGRSPRPRSAKGDGSPAARIKRVLTLEAGLPADQAMTQLRTELAKTTHASLPPITGPLDAWLKAVVAALPAGEVLNAAMTIARRAKA